MQSVSSQVTEQQQFDRVFHAASSTFYPAHLLFSESVKRDVQTLYAFVRTADDFVDCIPQDAKGFFAYAQEAKNALNGKQANNPIIRAFAALAKRKNFENEWTISFLESMQSDLEKTEYATYEELETYMYGSAEVIGLMMARVLGLQKQAEPFAKLQGKAFQLINIIRDISEDKTLGRTYIPKEDMQKFGLNTLDVRTESEKEQFSALIRFEIARYEQLQEEAREGYSMLPREVRTPIETAADAYAKTARELVAQPLSVE